MRSTLFLIIIWAGLTSGLFVTTYFLISWGRQALHKRKHMATIPPERRITTAQVVDYLAVYLLLWLTFAVNIPVLAAGLVQTPKTWVEFAGRVMLMIMLDAIAFLRAARWYNAKNAAEHEDYVHLGH